MYNYVKRGNQSIGAEYRARVYRIDNSIWRVHRIDVGGSRYDRIDVFWILAGLNGPIGCLIDYKL